MMTESKVRFPEFRDGPLGEQHCNDKEADCNDKEAVNYPSASRRGRERAGASRSEPERAGRAGASRSEAGGRSDLICPNPLPT